MKTKPSEPQLKKGDKVTVTYRGTIVAINYINHRILYQIETESGSPVFAYEDRDRISAKAL